MVRKAQRKTSSKKGRNPTKSDDIPRPAIRTYHTSSCTVPRVSDSTTVRAVSTTILVSQANAAQNPTFVFSLANSGLSTGTWDQYRIDAIRFTIASGNNAIGLYNTATTSAVPMACVIDYDDSTGLASLAVGQNYSNCIVLNPGESLERVFKPRMALAAYTGTFVGFANVSDQWIDSASTGVQHYGVKLYIPGTTAAQTVEQVWNVTVEYFISLRKNF